MLIQVLILASPRERWDERGGGGRIEMGSEGVGLGTNAIGVRKFSGRNPPAPAWCDDDRGRSDSSQCGESPKCRRFVRGEMRMGHMEERREM